MSHVLDTYVWKEHDKTRTKRGNKKNPTPSLCKAVLDNLKNTGFERFFPHFPALCDLVSLRQIATHMTQRASQGRQGLAAKSSSLFSVILNVLSSFFLAWDHYLRVVQRVVPALWKRRFWRSAICVQRFPANKNSGVASHLFRKPDTETSVICMYQQAKIVASWHICFPGGRVRTPRSGPALAQVLEPHGGRTILPGRL